MHLHEKRGSHKNNWLAQLKSLGLKPIMDVLETCDENTWQERERFWISHFRQMGFPMTNLDSGGNHGKSQSEETKSKIRAKAIGRRHTPESIAKIKATKKANLTPEVRSRIAAAQIGNRHSADTKAKMSASHKGHKTSEETRRKIGAANKITRLAYLEKMKSQLN